MTEIRPEMLSAYLDDELTPDERRAVEDCLIDTPDLRAEFEAVRQARDAVRGLPPLEVPPELAQRWSGASSPTRAPRSRRRRRVRAVAASAAASAAVWGAALVALPQSGVSAAAFALPLGELVSTHDEAVEHDGDPMAEVPSGSTAPAQPSANVEMVYAAKHDGGFHIMYRDDQIEFSLFEHQGRVAWDRLPADGERVSIDGKPGWFGEIGGYDVMVVEGRGIVYAVVAKEVGAMIESSIADDLDGEPKPSLWGRIKEASRDAVDVFGLRG